MPVPAGCEQGDGEYEYYESIDHKDPNQGHISGGSMGAVVAVLLLIVCVCLCSVLFCWKRRSNGKP